MTAAGWAATIALIVALLGLDWIVLGRRPHAVGFGTALLWSSFYIGVALLFGALLGAIAGWHIGLQYLTGYVVEKRLSIDNLLVFVIIIGGFAVPAEQQPKVISIGIAIALGLRAVLIALGAALLDAFSVVFLVFGLALIATAVQLFRHRNEDAALEDNLVVATARRVLPLSPAYEDGHILTRVGGRRAFTPLLLALLAIGTTDVMFALDSIPAVFGVTKYAFIVFAANAFALLGLRALYFLVSGLLDRLVYLSTGLAAILAFIGAKLVLEFAHDQAHAVPTISTGVSLAVVAAVLTVTALASALRLRHDPAARARTGALREPRRSRPPQQTSAPEADAPSPRQ